LITKRITIGGREIIFSQNTFSHFTKISQDKKCKMIQRTSSLMRYSTRVNNSTQSEQIIRTAAHVFESSCPLEKLSSLSIMKQSNESLDSIMQRMKQMDHPARPTLPRLVGVKEVPSIKQSGISIPIYMLHNCAHIELNAVDVCCHTIILPTLLEVEPFENQEEFYSDFLSVAKDEARHFGMLSDRLNELGSEYGALDSHKTLWEGAQKTNYSLIARVAMCQLINEGRGLDSGPRLVHKLKSAGDEKSAKIIQQIVDEEVNHVRIGVKWFKYLCVRDNLDPKTEYQRIVTTHYGPLPMPFNHDARSAAGMPLDWYEEMKRELNTESM
jgi:uncharacterized ferritin-like protein (DUF455 family)